MYRGSINVGDVGYLCARYVNGALRYAVSCADVAVKCAEKGIRYCIEWK